MSVAEVRHRLTTLSQQLPVSELAHALDTIRCVHDELSSALRSSNRTASREVLAATSAAASKLERIVAELGAVAAEIDEYVSRL